MPAIKEKFSTKVTTMFVKSIFVVNVEVSLILNLFLILKLRFFVNSAPGVPVPVPVT